MKQPKHQPIHLKDYQKPDYHIEEVELFFDLYDEFTQVRSLLKVKRNSGVPEYVPLVLNGEKLKLISVTLEGKAITQNDYHVTDKTLTLKDLPEKFALEIQVEIQPHKNEALEGLYKSGDIFVTQNEPEGFRKITFFLDRPDNMSRYRTTITAQKSKYPILLSNGNLIEKGDLKDGRHQVVWEDPFLKPCYLFALVAGDLGSIADKFVTRSNRTIELKIFVDKGNEDRAHHAMESLKKAMKWDEETFGLECDLNTYMIVAVDAFNQGAMENKGLNIFNSQSVLANPKTATDDDYEWIQSVVGHEYFHNWTGNRITCRDWFQLSLKEGLTVFRDQEFSADMTSRAVKRITDVRNLKNFQFPEDAGPNAHPVQPQSYIEIDNFYTPTVYEKGAEVIRMIDTLIGKEKFREGITKYFELYDGQAVTINEFVKAMEIVSAQDLTQFKLWYSQAGTPRCKVKLDYDANTQTATLTVEQSCRPTPETKEKKPFYFPLKLALLNGRGEEIAGTQKTLTVKKSKETFTFSGISEKPCPSLLRNFSAPVKLDYEYSYDDLKFLLKHDLDPVNRYEAANRLVLKSLRDLIQKTYEGQPLQLDSELVECFGAQLIDKSLDLLFRSELLSLPSLEQIVEDMEVCDYEAAFSAKEYFIEVFVKRFQHDLVKSYEENLIKGQHSNDAESVGKRTFKNICLSYLTSYDPEHLHLPLAFQQFEEADNMTDEISALRCLCQSDSPLRNQAIDSFYKKWNHDTLVMNKWFAVQASSKQKDTLNRVRQLESNQSFDAKNPNKIRSLYGVFSHNFIRFHEGAGEGYRFIADKVVSIDRFNPSIAARLSTAFKKYGKLDENRRNLMKKELERIMSTKGLSTGVYEIVSKTLET